MQIKGTHKNKAATIDFRSEGASVNEIADLRKLLIKMGCVEQLSNNVWYP